MTIPAEKVLTNHYRIDQKFSNSYTVWKEMGAPQNPTTEQISELEKAGQLHLFESPKWIKTKNGKSSIQIELPRQGVSLFQLSW